MFINSKIVLLLVLVYVSYSESRPNSRFKRVSDQRLAELNTKIGLSQLKGQIVTIPMAHGKLDPTRIGRRRRSQYSQPNLLEILLGPQDGNLQDENPPEYIGYEDSYKR